MSGALGGVVGAIGGIYDVLKKSKENTAAGMALDKEQQRNQAMSDPTHPISTQAREQFQRITGKALPDSTSAAQANDLLSGLQQIAGVEKGIRDNEKTMAETQGVQASTAGKQFENQVLNPLKPGQMKAETRLKGLEGDKIVDELQGGGKANKIASDLRQEYSNLPVTKNTQGIAYNYNKILRSAQSPSAVGDMSLIFGIMKMNDPNSSVREGEYATAEQAGPMASKYLNMYNKALTGQKLTDDQRADFLKEANNMYSSQMAQQQRVDSQYADISAKNKVDPRYVIQPFGVDEKFIADSRANVDKRVAEKKAAGSGLSNLFQSVFGGGESKASGMTLQDKAAQMLKLRQQGNK
jgi:hypothetical protein